MEIQSVYPLITTATLRETRAFYVRHFGFHVVFEADWVVMLSANEGGPICLGLMSPDHPSRPPGPETFDGRGMIITAQVADAAAAHERLRSAGAPIVYAPHNEPHDEPWGQRRFVTRDPSGTLIDVVEQIEPAAGFWEQYNPIA